MSLSLSDLIIPVTPGQFIISPPPDDLQTEQSPRCLSSDQTRPDQTGLTTNLAEIMTNVTVSSPGEMMNLSHLAMEEYEELCSPPVYYSGLYGLIGTIFQSSIFLVGIAGNLLVVVMVKISKSLHTTTNCYLVSLALADLITLLSSVPQVRFFVLSTAGPRGRVLGQ